MSEWTNGSVPMLRVGSYVVPEPEREYNESTGALACAERDCSHIDSLAKSKAEKWKSGYSTVAPSREKEKGLSPPGIFL